ncbi:MAG: IS1380 family transposase [Rhodospirillales bacterium]|jgi:hypothetical protein|nr:IS1380 family transposase [Rhodospirillales bacterium]|tara:strand:- start:191 stop:1531 length:1341 start_codon:yes stop_codon:yes gene_type:complete
MGDAVNRGLKVEFDPSMQLEFRGAKITSIAGIFAYRELDEMFGLTAMGNDLFSDFRTGRNTRHAINGLLRQGVYSRLAGYEDTNDAERLCIDPAMRRVIGGRAVKKQGASTSQMGRFETEVLTELGNMEELMNLPGMWIDRMNTHKQLKKLVLDMDSSVSPTHGKQEGSQYNGHFECNCYHPLFCFNQFGEVERALLREGNVHSANDWESVLTPVIERYRGIDVPKFFRGDAAFATPELFERLEQEEFQYAIRLKSNEILHRKVEPLLKRGVGRPSRTPAIKYHSLMYQAKSWDKPRRVVVKVEFHHDELFPRVGFIVTNLAWSAKRVVKFYNKRGTAEQWIKEGKYAVHWTRLSCHDFDDNQVRLQLFVLAYNLGVFLHRVGLPGEMKSWSLTRIRDRMIHIGARLVRHARRATFQMAETGLSRQVFGEILKRIHRLALLGTAVP